MGIYKIVFVVAGVLNSDIKLYSLFNIIRVQVEIEVMIKYYQRSISKFLETINPSCPIIKLSLFVSHITQFW